MAKILGVESLWESLVPSKNLKGQILRLLEREILYKGV